MLIVLLDENNPVMWYNKKELLSAKPQDYFSFSLLLSVSPVCEDMCVLVVAVSFCCCVAVAEEKKIF